MEMKWLKRRYTQLKLPSEWNLTNLGLPQWPPLYMESLFLNRQVYTKCSNLMGMPFLDSSLLHISASIHIDIFPQFSMLSWLDHLVLFQSGHWCQINLTKNRLHDVIPQFKTLFKWFSLSQGKGQAF